MTLRVFAFIWSGNLITLFLFALLVTIIDPRLPVAVRAKAETEILSHQLSTIYIRDGLKQTLTLWQKIAAAHPDYRLEPTSRCPDIDPIGTPELGCLMLSFHGKGADPLTRLTPASGPLLLGALVSAAMAIALSRWVTEPIRDLSHGLREIAAGHLETRLNGTLRTSNSEIRALGKDFDYAAERLQALSEGRTRLFHDISHEIRSPLARLRAAVGLIGVNPSRGAALAARMEGDIARLDHLVTEILTLARFERGEKPGDLRKIDLLDLLENIINDANFEGKQRAISVSYSGAERLELWGRPELLHRACENVIRNAISHSPEGGEVHVKGHLSTAAVTLSIYDNGPGVPEADLKMIFSPFARVDTAPPSPGIGLGLAIASSAVQSHGGTITARNRTPEGLQVDMILPRSPTATQS